jgi:heavy metal sensor kinase
MIRRTARLSAAIRYTSFFLVVLLILDGAVYLLIRGNAYSRLDQNLASALNVTSAGILHEIQEHGGKKRGEESIGQVLPDVYQTSFPQEQIVVREGARIVAYKPNLGPKQSDLRVFQESREPFRNSGDLRVAWRRLYVPEAQTTYVVLVSTWRSDVIGDLHSVLHALALTIPISFLIVAAGAYLLARRTLAPLAEMAATVDEITSTNLDRRVRIRNSDDEVGQLAARFNRLLNRLQSSFAQQRRFMSDASHELRTPIAAALTAAQVTLQTQSRGEQEYRDALRMIEEQMLRLRRIVQDMFLLAQADAHSMPLKREALYFDEIISEACRAMDVLCREKGIELHIAPMPEIQSSGDPGLLRQAIIILVDNARKYTPPGGLIGVSVELRRQSCVLRVSDTGCGIPLNQQNFIFDRFYRVDKGRSRSASDVSGSGAGLGLSIARWIAELHRGELRLENSQPDAGSIFALEIPVPDSMLSLSEDEQHITQNG